MPLYTPLLLLWLTFPPAACLYVRRRLQADARFDAESRWQQYLAWRHRVQVATLVGGYLTLLALDWGRAVAGVNALGLLWVLLLWEAPLAALKVVGQCIGRPLLKAAQPWRLRPDDFTGTCLSVSLQAGGLLFQGLLLAALGAVTRLPLPGPALQSYLLVTLSVAVGTATLGNLVGAARDLGAIFRSKALPDSASPSAARARVTPGELGFEVEQRVRRFSERLEHPVRSVILAEDDRVSGETLGITVCRGTASVPRVLAEAVGAETTAWLVAAEALGDPLAGRTGTWVVAVGMVAGLLFLGGPVALMLVWNNPSLVATAALVLVGTCALVLLLAMQAFRFANVRRTQVDLRIAISLPDPGGLAEALRRAEGAHEPTGEDPRLKARLHMLVQRRARLEAALAELRPGA